MLVLVAVLMALTAVAVALSPRDGGGGPAAPGATTPAQVRPAAGDDAASPRERDGVAPGETPIRTLDAEDSGQIVRVSPGDRLRVRVVSDELETVQLGTDGPIEVVDRDSPAEFELLADRDLDADVRLLESGRTIGRVTVQR